MRPSLPIEEAVSTYLFNSQILSLPRQSGCDRIMLCPIQVEQNPRALSLVRDWQAQDWFTEVQFVDLGQSMDGGGGPACLRLRVPMRDDELGLLDSNRLWSERIDEQLREAIFRNYPTEVTMEDLGRVDFMEHASHARDRIAAILKAVG